MQFDRTMCTVSESHDNAILPVGFLVDVFWAGGAYRRPLSPLRKPREGAGRESEESVSPPTRQGTWFCWIRNRNGINGLVQ